MVSEFVYEKIVSILGKNKCLKNEPLKNHTSFKIGGPCDLLIVPKCKDDLIISIKILKENSVKYYIMGNGSNLLVRDNGISDVVIKMTDINHIKVNGDRIIAGAGALLSDVSNFALENRLSGLEFAVGIPGTIGGAVAMNAGAYDSEIKNVVIETHCIDLNGNLVTLSESEHEFGYRNSAILKQNLIVVETEAKLKHEEYSLIKTKMDEFQNKRNDKQPLEMPSAGSVFKRPKGHYVGKLVEDCGLRGYSIGDAQISNKHCGFIVNNGNATAEEVIRLIKHVQLTIKEECGVELETEVRIIGKE